MSEGAYELLFLKALAWTLLFEVPVVVALLKWGPWKTDLGWSRAVCSGLVPTVLTLPYLWFLGPWLLRDRTVRMLVTEPIIALVEAGLLMLLARLGWRRALVVSVAANLLSFLAGEFLPLL